MDGWIKPRNHAQLNFGADLRPRPGKPDQGKEAVEKTPEAKERG